MDARVARGLAQLVDDVLGRRHVGIAHAEIDDVLAARARVRLEAIDFLEDIRRQPLDAVKFGLHVRNLSIGETIFAIRAASR